MGGDEAARRLRLDLQLVAEPAEDAHRVEIVEVPSPAPAVLVLDLVPLPAVGAIDPELESVPGGAGRLRLHLLPETDDQVQERELVPRFLVGLADFCPTTAKHHGRRLLSRCAHCQRSLPASLAPCLVTSPRGTPARQDGCAEETLIA
jgi:hypothetical protein